MSDKMALKLAIDLVHVPSQVRLFRSEPLPDDVVMLLRIAAGDTEMERMAVALADRSREVVQRAAEFFIEQILFFPNADSYRVLGATPQASTAELRRNVALLLRWLHPDVDPRGERSIFVGKVTAAWNDLKDSGTTRRLRRSAADSKRQKRVFAQKSAPHIPGGVATEGHWPLCHRIRAATSQTNPCCTPAAKRGSCAGFSRSSSISGHINRLSPSNAAANSVPTMLRLDTKGLAHK